MSMTPQEHYAEAERLIAVVESNGLPLFNEAKTHADMQAANQTNGLIVALAHVHALLAAGVKVEQHHHYNTYNTGSDRGAA